MSSDVPLSMMFRPGIFTIKISPLQGQKGWIPSVPSGPSIVTGLNPDNLKIETRLNGKTVQSSNTNDLLFNVPQLISFVSKYITLLPGDLIATGTPAGSGPLNKGDVIEVEVEGIGVLKNFVS